MAGRNGREPEILPQSVGNIRRPNQKPFHRLAQTVEPHVLVVDVIERPFVAAFGTGKTVIGACIAALLVQRGHRIVITASTNVAVAQITETILGVDLAAGMPLCRFVAETVQYDESVPRTAVDMNEVLKSFADRFRKVLSDALLNTCERYRRGRILVDDHHRNRIPAGRSLTPLEREELLVAERDVSDLMEDMVAIMFRWYCPDILLITTSSLLNTTSAGGIFRDYLGEFDILLCDEASQVPEPVFAAMLSRLPQARHIYIGDLHQLEPFARCSRSTSAALLGARSMIDVLTRARAVPAASLITTFRAHPGLIDLPNQFTNESLPFICIDVDRVLRRSTTMSRTNESEAEVCRTIVQRLIQRGIEPATIGLIAFYRDQHRHLANFARSVGVDLATVDSIQGREKDVVILLTTRPHFTPETSEFIDDVYRRDVALTRCRHGQLVLGHQLSLVAVPVWHKVLTCRQNHGALVDVDMEEYLPALQEAGEMEAFS
ncbi:unnamed protein product [Nippostrongylus brasiliensis]|uniref:Probable helicase senataxin (inferred by orthology to a human protein) n=1 Tax=Nippostrongylus brasiliensis TaxID=27835 RepID=A0A158R2W1_NIPBR|nr:unnamed protein product [Nippostrongylus brasiliensis]